MLFKSFSRWLAELPYYSNRQIILPVSLLPNPYSHVGPPLMDKGWNLDLKAIHLNKGAGPDTFKIATVKKDYNQLVLEP